MVSQLFALFSRIWISTGDNSYDAHARDNLLTARFVEDLAKLNDQPLLLLFDGIDSASKFTQTWLLHMFLPSLSQFSHVRVVVAGCTMPEAHASYAAFSQRYQLIPVTEAEEYIAYCQQINIALAEQSIRDFARAAHFRPGFFVELVVPTFAFQQVPDE